MSENTILLDQQDLLSPLTKTHAPPKLLLALGLVEIWERFAYWALFSLLILFMSQQLNLADTKSYVIFAAYNALLYTAPLLGG